MRKLLQKAGILAPQKSLYFSSVQDKKLRRISTQIYMKKISLLFLFFVISGAYAYTPSANFVSFAERLSGQLDRIVLGMESGAKSEFISSV